VGDFGLTSEGTSTQNITTAYARGTPGYRAPELLGSKAVYNQKVDIWSMGCILYELAVCQKLFDDDFHVHSLLWSKWEMVVPFDNRFDEHAKQIITKNVIAMLQVEASLRPTAKEVLEEFSRHCQFMQTESCVSTECLFWIARNGDVDAMDTFLTAMVDVAPQDREGYTALIWAARNGYTEVVQMLLNAKVDINVQDNEESTALIWAARNRHTDVVKILVDAKADMNVQDEDGFTAVTWAAREGYADVIQILRISGADMTIQDKEGLTARNWAMIKKHTDAIKTLWNAKTEVNAQLHAEIVENTVTEVNVLGYDPMIPPALMQEELPSVHSAIEESIDVYSPPNH